MPFVPTDETGLQSWQNPNTTYYTDTTGTIPTTTDGALVKAWGDASGNTFLFAASAGATLKNGILAGKSVLRFDGASNYLINPHIGYLFRSTQAVTFFVVARETGPGGGGNGVVASWNTAAVDNDYGLGRIHDTANGNGQTIQRTNLDTVRTDAADIGTNWIIYAVRYDGTLTTVTTLGSTRGGSGSSGTNASTIDQVVLGAIVRPANPGGVLYFQGDIAEFLIYDHYLSDIVFNNVIGYLQAELNLSYTVAPTVTVTNYYDGGELGMAALMEATQFKVKRSPHGANTFTPYGQTGTQFFFDDGYSTSYDYIVAGWNGTTEGPYSGIVTVTPVGGTATLDNIAPCIRGGAPDGLGLTNGTSISNNVDIGGLGLGNDATNTGSNRPVYETAILNGIGMAHFTQADQQCLLCDGVAPWLSGYNAPRTILQVLMLASIDTDQSPWTLATATDPTTNDLLVQSGKKCLEINKRNTIGDQEAIFDYGLLDTAAHIHGYTFLNGVASVYLDGAFMNACTAAIGQETYTRGTLGGHRKGTTDKYLNAWMGDDRWYRCGFTTAKMKIACDLLRTKWATPAASAVPFNPTMLGGVAFELRDDRLNALGTLSNGDPVPVWPNSSCCNIFPVPSTLTDDFVPSSGTATLVTSGIDGKPSLALPGSGEHMHENTFLAPRFTATDFTLWGACKATGVAALQELFSLGNSATSAAISGRITTVPAWAAKEINDAASPQTISGGTPDTSKHAFQFEYDLAANIGTLLVDGALVAIGPMSGGAATFDRIALGALWGASASNAFVGQYSLFGGAPRRMASPEKAAIWVYIGARYDITIKLQPPWAPVEAAFGPGLFARFFTE